MALKIEELESLLKDINGLVEKKKGWESERSELVGKKAAIEESICNLLGLSAFDQVKVEEAMQELEKRIASIASEVGGVKEKLKELQTQL